jgi:hypothetical protein
MMMQVQEKWVQWVREELLPNHKSAATLDEWRRSLAEGKTPRGRAVRSIVRVRPGEEVEIVLAGGSHFGSGGYYARAVWAGEEPEVVAVRYERTSCNLKVIATLRLRAPSIVREYAEDLVGRISDPPRVLVNRVYVCE